MQKNCCVVVGHLIDALEVRTPLHHRYLSSICIIIYMRAYIHWHCLQIYAHIYVYFVYARIYSMEVFMSSDAQRKATAKYKGKFIELRYRVTDEERNIIKKYCEEHDISINEFTRKLVFDEINKHSN